MHEGDDEVEFLPGAAAEGAGPVPGPGGEPQFLQEFPGTGGLRQAVGDLEVPQVLGDGEGVVQDHGLRAVADGGGQAHRPPVGAQFTGEDAQQGALARAVLPDHADQPAGRGVQVGPVQDGTRAVAFVDVSEAQHGCGRRHGR